MYAVNKSVLDKLNNLAANFNKCKWLLASRTNFGLMPCCDTYWDSSVVIMTGCPPANTQQQHRWHFLPECKLLCCTSAARNCRQHYAPLMRVVDMKLNSKKLKMHTILDCPLYVPLQKKSFNTIEINIMTDTGNPVHTLCLSSNARRKLEGLQKWVQ